MNKAEELVLDFFAKVWHAPHDHSAIDILMTEEYSIHSAGQNIQGRSEFKKWIERFQKTLLESTTDSVDVFSNEAGDKVVSRWVCSGINNGILGLPADGKRITFTGIAIWTVRENRLSECWIERGAYELYQELISDPQKNFL